MSYKISRYGWLLKLLDRRDYFYVVPVAIASALPVSAYLHLQCPPVYSGIARQLHAVIGASYDDGKSLASDFWTICVVA
jgi:hypothetical protein